MSGAPRWGAAPPGGPHLSRREALRLGGLALAGSALRVPVASAQAPDALGRRIAAELAVFTGWLAEHRVPGFIGEVGWPGGPAEDAVRWNAVAEAWYRDAARSPLWVCNWAAGEWWGSYALATYRASASGRPIDRPGRQARVVERHPTRGRALRGVSLAGPAFGFPSTNPVSALSNRAPGVLERDYHYDQPASYAYLGRRGIRLLRLEFRWERIQRAPFAPLHAGELRRLRAAVRSARAHGLRVVLDLHNYGGYYLHDPVEGRGVRRILGSGELPYAALEDVWVRLSRAFRDEPGVIALGLMNEPTGKGANAQPWEAGSAGVVRRLRAAGEERTITVSGWSYSNVQDWPGFHPVPWVPDERIRYEAHHYFDAGHDSRFGSYAEENRRAAAAEAVVRP